MEIYEKGIPTFHEARVSLATREDRPGLSYLTLNEDGKTFTVTPGVEEWRSLSRKEKYAYRENPNVTFSIIMIIISTFLMLSALIFKNNEDLAGFLALSGVAVFLASIFILTLSLDEGKEKFDLYSETSNRDSNRTKDFLEFDKDCQKIILESLKIKEGTGTFDYLQRAYNEKAAIHIAERERVAKKKQKMAQEREEALDNRQYEAVKRMLDLSTVNTTIKSEQER